MSKFQAEGKGNVTSWPKGLREPKGDLAQAVRGGVSGAEQLPSRVHMEIDSRKTNPSLLQDQGTLGRGPGYRQTQS